VAADGVPVPRGLLGAEPAGDLLLDLGRSHVSLGLVRGRGYAQVGQEPEHVVLAVAQAFQQQPGGRLSHVGAGDPPDLGQSDADAVAEQPQVFRLGVGGNGGKALVAGEARGVDQGAQRAGDLAGPDGRGVGLGGVLEVSEQVSFMPISA
jgi:hypothetical protein